MMLQRNGSFATCNRLNQLLTRLVCRASENNLCLRISPHILISTLSFILALQVCIGYFSPICYQADSKKYRLSLFPCFFFLFCYGTSSKGLRAPPMRILTIGILNTNMCVCIYCICVCSWEFTK